MNSDNNKYTNGKIYSITCHSDDSLIYIGSTCQPLYKRFVEHKKASKEETKKNRPLYVKMNELGFDDFHIELIINYPSETKEELNKLKVNIYVN